MEVKKYKLNLLIVVLFSIIAMDGWTQNKEIEKINWVENPVLTVLDKEYADEPEVVLELEKKVEYAYSEKYQDRLVQYFTLRKKVRVNSDDAVEYNNKVYINMHNSLELVDAKARVITPSGDVINFNKENLNQSEGGDGQDAHSYFAIDGMEVGSDVEFTYTVVRIPSYDGTKMNFQDDIFTLNVLFQVIAPENLLFAFKSYNGFPEMNLDTNRTDKNVYSVSCDVIPKLEDEDYASYERNLQSIVYKLEANSYSNKTKLISFGDISQNIFAVFTKVLDKADAKALDKMIKEINLKNSESDDEKIRMVERYIKTNIQLIEGVETKTIKDILADNYSSSVGFFYLFCKTMDALKIDYEIVLTCDRNDDFFDESFEHYHVLSNKMVYFPNSKKFLVPDDFIYRYGFLPASWSNQKGLFIKKVEVGDLVTGVGRVKHIEPLPAELTKDVMDVQIQFTDILEPTIRFERKLSGYSGIYYQPIYTFLDDDGKKELDEEVMKFADKNGEVIEYKVTGVEDVDIAINPMVYSGVMKSTSLIEKAGNKYLFKVGEVIGPQAEMYEDKERKLDIEHNHNMIYDRTISFEIPEGYQVSGLESLSISEEYPADNPVIGFVSKYTQDANVVNVTVNEYYKEINFSKDEIGDFRRVINAAANFNKIVVFIEKK